MSELGKVSPQISIILKIAFSSMEYFVLKLIKYMIIYVIFWQIYYFFNIYKLIGYTLMLKNAGKRVIGSSFQSTNFAWITSILHLTREWIARLATGMHVFKNIFKNQPLN